LKHGANIYKYAKEICCKADEIIDFSSNINLYQPKNDLVLQDATIVKYADQSYTKLKKTISQKYSLKTEQISLFNGASSAIFELFKALKPKKVYLYAPLYGEYENGLDKDVKIKKINRFENLLKTPSYNSTVVFVNPSTPEGKYYDLKKLFKIWQKQNCTVILDESFLEFEELKSFRKKINTYKKLYIIQSFSKFYSCAGVRIGAVFSNKKNLKKFKQPIWNISSLDVEFLTKRLMDKKFEKKSIMLHKKQKNELKKILKRFKYIYKSDSNFFLVKCTNKNKLFQHLLNQKILVRRCGSFDFLNDEYFRFAVKDKNSHKKLKKALKEYDEYSCRNFCIPDR